MKYLFHLNVFNDVDHIVPIIWRFLEKGEKVDIIFLSDFDFKKDYRISFLLKYKGLSVSRAGFFQRLRNKVLYNSKSRSLMDECTPYRSIIRYLSENIWRNRYLKSGNIVAVVYEWGNGFRLNHYDALVRGIPAIALPHGFNIFTNYDINHNIVKIKNNSGKWPDFSYRNIFDAYVVQTDRHRLWSIDWGQSSDRVDAWGSVRFYPIWSDYNAKLCGQMKRSISKNLVKIVFFLPHWSYNVNMKNVINLLDKLNSLSYIYLFVKGHTRGTGTISEEHINVIGKSNNIEFNVKENSPQLIAYSDVVINFGSSIAIDAINMGIPIIHTPYLHTNTTIFDDGLVNYVAHSDEEVISLIDKCQAAELNLPTANEKNLFYRNEIYAGCDKYDVIELYYKNIKKLSEEIKREMSHL